MTAVLRILVLLCVARVAAADAPKSYKCGPGGYRVRDACRCPAEKLPARDGDVAICAPKPEPAPTACLADRKGKHSLKIDSSPVGATLYLGSTTCGPVGRTPWTGKLAAGPVLVILEHQSYVTETREIGVSSKSKTTFFTMLQRTNEGAVEIRADADPGVHAVPVTIDGQAKGKIPVHIRLPVGRHLVEIARPGFDPFTQWVDVQDGQTTLLLPVLRAIVIAKARMVIDADVPQAEVFVNGERKGTTPLAIDNLTLGNYNVVVKKPPAKDWAQKVTLGAGTTLVRAELAATMPKTPTDGELEITADAAGAEVVIDGTVAGKTPFLAKLPAGSHWIQVRLAGRLTFEKTLSLEAGKRISVAAVLVRATEVRVASTPAGSTVFVDGVRRGLTPLVLELPRGAHTVIVERTGYQRFEKKLELADKPISIDARLVR